ncbi:MAG: polyprenyl synthetase family protein [Candidatus Woesearchaeota archaeon]|jgi:geranylgeranyl diphosphate synthase type I|nr:polyprenyl synthetase family protein [Candidatus Woesearchaeota archaeon]MDP7506269.1 polyprenyl synthetase family protein [Candidatus Woesearchaeota archaeon]MDP7610594.1 polyprenyl synthetase family protein [Candidatus Woesearchaeota archaeon]|tara:strand:+ start:4699 stop:5766 length:1068 start_codon:yes stop_codon:yes gene_type:complete
MDTKGLLKKYKKDIDSELRKFFDSRINRVKNIDVSALELMEILKEFTMNGGKRIRPILVILGYKCVGGRDEREIIKAALCVELMQSFLLIHDDIIDDDELRRGNPTVHKVYEDRYKRDYPAIDSKKFGKDMGIITGDIGSILGSEVILETKFSSQLKVRALEKFNRVVVNTAFGEMLDILSGVKQEINEEDILKIHKLKTALYTIEGPLHIGAILGEASKEQMDVLSKFAISLGQAFQVQDDILGMFGSVETIGKPVGSDLKEGKKTLLIKKALEKANNKDKKVVMKSLGNKNVSKKDVEMVKEIIVKTGSLDYSKELANEMVMKAKHFLCNGDLKRDGKEFLLGLADYVVKRKC